MDDPALVQLIHFAGEQCADGDGTSLARSAGDVLTWGAATGPDTSPSRVRPQDLAAVAVQLLSNTNNER
jgi:hypothetical protein